MRRHGLTLMELVVAVAIIAMLVMLLLPVLVQARKRGYEPTCISNLRQLHVALMNYYDDHSESFPDLQRQLWSYVSDKRILKCPADFIPYGAASLGPNPADMPPETWTQTSYFYVGDQFFIHREVREDSQIVDYLERLREADPNHGLMVCLMHGEPVQAEYIFEVRSAQQMRGKILRLRKDGSVQHARSEFTCYRWLEDSPVFGIRLPWQMFTDVRPVPLGHIRWHFDIMDEGRWELVPCPPGFQ